MTASEPGYAAGFQQLVSFSYNALRGFMDWSVAAVRVEALDDEQTADLVARMRQVARGIEEAAEMRRREKGRA